MNLQAIINRKPSATYFFATFFISWLGAFLLVAPKLLSGKPIQLLDGLLMFPIMLIGPVLVGIVLTGITGSKAGIKNLFARMGNWRVNIKWYAVLLIPPILILVVLFSMSSYVSVKFVPHLMPGGMIFGILAGFLEETGWTGFAYTKLRIQLKPLYAALLLALLWGFWHLPVIDFLGAAHPHGRYLVPFFIAFFIAMSAIRILIVWLYANTESLLLAQLMHASSTSFLVMFSPSFVTPAEETLWYFVYAAALWLVVAIILLIYGKRCTSLK
jgi:uncharacterized protein